jgi:hypothetical protein
MTYGTINADVIATSTPQGILGAGDASIMKNRIINGAMGISQRGTSFANDASGTQYSLDRWNIYGTSSNEFTVTQGNSAPAGFSNCLTVTSSAATTVGASDTYLVQQSIEGFNTADLNWGSANAKTVTLSFWVQSSLTGIFGGSISNSAFNYSYPFSYSIPVANTWTQISITIAGPTSGTWIGATNGIGMRVEWSMGSGSSVSGTSGAWTSSGLRSATGAVQVVATNAATWSVTGVQLEVGSSATGFEYRQYQQELALCERYYQLISAMNGTTGGSGGSSVYCSIPVRTSMRATPAAGQTGVLAFETPFGNSSTQSSGAVTLISAASNNNGVYVYFTNFSGLSANYPVNKYNNTNALTLSAEL